MHFFWDADEDSPPPPCLKPVKMLSLSDLSSSVPFSKSILSHSSWYTCRLQKSAIYCIRWFFVCEKTFNLMKVDFRKYIFSRFSLNIFYTAFLFPTTTFANSCFWTVVGMEIRFKRLFLIKGSTVQNSAQYAEWIVNEIAKATNKTLTGLDCMLQRFRIYFLWNPSFKGIESAT